MASHSQSKQNLIRSGISTMVQITYIDHLDNITMVDVKTGLSVGSTLFVEVLARAQPATYMLKRVGW
jgi:hypothetical protein